MEAPPSSDSHAASAVEIDLSRRPEHILLGFSEDVADLALFIPSEVLPRVGEKRTVRLTLPSGETVEVVGEVKIHREAHGQQRRGYVMRFVDLDEEARSTLSSYVRASTAPIRISHPPSSAPSSSRRHSGRFSAVLDVQVGIDVEAHVTLDSDHNFFAGFSENIGEGGIFVQSWVHKSVGDHVTLRIVLPDDEDDPIETIGEVRWVRAFDRAHDTPPGFGVSFLDLHPGDRARIDKFLRQRKPIFYDD